MNPKRHDFTKPTRLPAEWLERLTAWCRAAWGLANKSWPKSLGTPLEGTLLAVDVCYAGPALSRVGESSLMYRVNIGEACVSYLNFPRGTILNLVGSLLGDHAGAAQDRELTLIEEKLADFFLTHYWLAFFREAWPGPSAPAWILGGREGNPSSSKRFSPTDVLIQIDWRLKGNWGEADGAWCFPKKGLLDALSDVAAAGAEAKPVVPIEVRRDAAIQQIPLEMQILLGTTQLQLSELSSLRVGDVILLDQRADEGIVARIDERPLFRGQGGRVGAWKAFQVEANLTK